MYFNSPIAADLDGNGSLEIVVNHARKVLIFDGITGENLICSENCANDYPSFSLSGSVNNSPAIADLDGDGRLDLVAAGGRGLSVWTGFDQLIDSTPGANVPYSAPWSQARRNAMRTGS